MKISVQAGESERAVIERMFCNEIEVNHLIVTEEELADLVEKMVTMVNVTRRLHKHFGLDDEQGGA